ncbi:MAG: hypothetical protein IKA56_02955 [Clostridia bacterium]|nr:hypothetical protein [Clostridia bacterium]
MPFALFLIFIFTVGPLIIWCIINEDMLIEIEDRIIEDIRSQLAENRRKKNIRVVSGEKPQPKRAVRESSPCGRGYVA